MFQQRRFKFQEICLKMGVCLILAACSSGGGGPQGPRPCETFDCQGMLNNLANTIMLPAVNTFSTDAAAMAAAVNAYFTALGVSDPAIAERDAARAAWTTAMSSFQALEMMQVGPLSDNLGLLRNNLYSWPTTNPCGVDQDVTFAESGFLVDGTTPYLITGRTADRRGMDALEYVLFSENLDHTCVGGNIIPDLFNWNALPDSERRAARGEFASLAAADVAAQAQTLKTGWDGPNGFLVELTQPGSPGSRFASVEAAVNAVSDALFYYEDETKDRKLAEPIGVQNPLVTNACNQLGIPVGPGATGCPEAVESPFSLTSKENIRINLVTLQELFLGNKPTEAAGVGFDDFLDALGEANASAPLRDGISNAIPALDAIPGDLKTAVVTDYATVKAAWTAAKVVTDQMKNNFVFILGLNIPASAAADGD